MTNNKRGGTIKKRKSSSALSSERPDKKPKPILGMTLDLGQAERVRAEMNREDDDKLFLQRQRKQNEEDIKQSKVKETYLSPFWKDKYEHTTHDQTKSTPKRLFDEWQEEAQLGEYADASEAGVTMSALRPEHKVPSKSIKYSNPKNLFKGGRSQRQKGGEQLRLNEEWIEHILHFYYDQEDISDKISRDDLKEILKKLKYDKDYISPITGEPVRIFGYQAMAKVDAFYKYGDHIGGKRKSRKSKRKSKKAKRKTRKHHRRK